jgi:hypothetical protein
MTKNVYAVGFLLFVITMLVFFGVYFFGYNTHYFTISLLVNAFLLPAIYTLGAYASVNALKKENKDLGFRDAFGRAFKPMFIGGWLSVMCIFGFLNYVDTDAKALLNFQFVERNKKELTEIYHKQRSILKSEKEKTDLDRDYKKSMSSFSQEMVKDKDMFTFRQFTYYFAAILVFYTILSTFFGSFFRSRSEH